MESTERKSTHGACLEYVGKDGIKRHINVAVFDGGTYQISLFTYWDGPEKEPTATHIKLGTEAMSALASLMIELMTNRDKYETKHTEEVKP
jgi:hypothetical protein